MILMTIGTVGICIFGVIYLIGHTIESVKMYLPKKEKTEKIEEPEVENETETEVETETETK